MAQNEKRLREAIEAFIAEIRASERETCEECGLKYADPLADVRIDRDPESGLLRLTYDGAGFDFFSVCSDARCLMLDAAREFGWDIEKVLAQPTTRDRFDMMLKRYGYYGEDCNSWSMVFVYEGGEPTGADLPDEQVEEV